MLDPEAWRPGESSVDYWAQIITASSRTTLGLAALAMLILGGLALPLLKGTSPAARLTVYLVLIVGAGLLIYAFGSGPPASGGVAVEEKGNKCSAPDQLNAEEIEKCVELGEL